MTTGVNFRSKRVSRGSRNLAVGTPTWLTSSDRAVVQGGKFLAASEPTWEKVEGRLGYDALTLSEKKYVLSVFRFGTGLGDSNFSCIGIREKESKELIDARWQFVVEDFLVVVLVATESFDESIEAAVIPH